MNQVAGNRQQDGVVVNNNPCFKISVNLSNDLERRIADAFSIFDHHGNKSVDVREIGSIIRYLGCVPDENELNEIISATELEDSSGVVHLSKFLPHIQQILMENKIKPAAPEKLLKAFQILDPEGRGYLTRDSMAKILMEEGEPFTQVMHPQAQLNALQFNKQKFILQEELDEMMAVAVDPATNTIPYEFFINQLMVSTGTKGKLLEYSFG